MAKLEKGDHYWSQVASGSTLASDEDLNVAARDSRIRVWLQELLVKIRELLYGKSN